MELNDKTVCNNCNVILSFNAYYYNKNLNNYVNKCKLCTNLKLKNTINQIKIQNINAINEQNYVENILKCMKCK